MKSVKLTSNKNIFIGVVVLVILVIVIAIFAVNKKESFDTQPLLIDQPNPLASQFYYALDGHKLSTGPWSMNATTTNSGNNGVEFASSLGRSSYSAY